MVALVVKPPRLPGGVTPDIDLQLVATVADQVVHIANSGVAGDDRLFLVRKRGIIQIYDGGAVLTTPFLDIDSLVVGVGGLPEGDERGLLSIAFHPDYDSNGLFYVHYIDNNSDSVVARYQVSGNPDVANALSAQTVLTLQPATNHKGGQLQFGPDDYLYVGLGDGGGACDSTGPGCNAQRTDAWFGKLLRIDVDGDDFPGNPNRNYAIPPDNPFVTDGSVVDEIWAYGLRNPWRFSFDRTTGDLWIGDVGQSGTASEEINFNPREWGQNMVADRRR
jgi:glucose/arabinose dehydrogenase